MLPTFVEKYFNDYNELNCYLLFYSILVTAFVNIVILLELLSAIHKGYVFSETSVFLLRLLSWGCIAECVLFLIMSRLFTLSYLCSFGCLFIGVILRVVKNVIEEATFIKKENDYTV